MPYQPPAVWSWDPEQVTTDGNPILAINRPHAGSTHEGALPVGEHPFQLYSLATPNGVKVTILFEELLEAGSVEPSGRSSRLGRCRGQIEDGRDRVGREARSSLHFQKVDMLDKRRWMGWKTIDVRVCTLIFLCLRSVWRPAPRDDTSRDWI